MKLSNDNMLLVTLIGIASIAIIAAFFGGFVFGNRGHGVVFDRDNSGRISGIFSVPNVVR